MAEEEEEFADDSSRRMQSLAEEVVGRLVDRGAELAMDEVPVQLNRVPDTLFYSLSSDARGLLGQEVTDEVLRSAGRGIVRGQDIEHAARRIGARIRAGTGEFSRLSQVDRNAIIDGCPWC